MNTNTPHTSESSASGGHSWGKIAAGVVAAGALAGAGVYASGTAQTGDRQGIDTGELGVVFATGSLAQDQSLPDRGESYTVEVLLENDGDLDARSMVLALDGVPDTGSEILFDLDYGLQVDVLLCGRADGTSGTPLDAGLDPVRDAVQDEVDEPSDPPPCDNATRLYQGPFNNGDGTELVRTEFTDATDRAVVSAHQPGGVDRVQFTVSLPANEADGGPVPADERAQWEVFGMTGTLDYTVTATLGDPISPLPDIPAQPSGSGGDTGSGDLGGLGEAVPVDPSTVVSPPEGVDFSQIPQDGWQLTTNLVTTGGAGTGIDASPSQFSVAVWDLGQEVAGPGTIEPGTVHVFAAPGTTGPYSEVTVTEDGGSYTPDLDPASGEVRFLLVGASPVGQPETVVWAFYNPRKPDARGAFDGQGDAGEARAALDPLDLTAVPYVAADDASVSPPTTGA